MLACGQRVHVFPVRVLAVARRRFTLRRREPVHVSAMATAAAVTAALMAAAVMTATDVAATVVASGMMAAPSDGARRDGDKRQGQDGRRNFHNGTLSCCAAAGAEHARCCQGRRRLSCLLPRQARTIDVEGRLFEILGLAASDVS
jgi:hypothetical protein